MGLTSLHYADNLPSLLEPKRYLGHYANRPIETKGPYLADQGWNQLFTDYLDRRLAKKEKKRAGATVKEIVHNDAREQEYTPETSDRRTKEAMDDSLRS